MRNEWLICGMTLWLGTASLARGDDPADALQPVNRSEILLLMERIAALEQRAAERESQQQQKIAELEGKLRAIEYAQPIKQRNIIVRDSRRYGREEWYRPWFETVGRLAPTGEFESQASESLKIIYPRPYVQRGRTILSLTRQGYGRLMMYVVDPAGDEYEYFWIAPSTEAWKWSHPLERGFLLGVDLKQKPSEETSIDEFLSTMWRRDETRSRNYGLNAY